jgi:hypothetical protein
MMKRRIAILLAGAPIAAGVAQTAPPPKPAAGSIFDKAVNQPGIGWSIYGTGQTAKQVAAAGVPGGAAVRVQVSRAGEHPWDIGAAYPTVKPIAAGDTMVVMVYLRAPDAKDGSTLTLPIGATEADSPYTTIADASVQVGPVWKRFFASGVSPKALAAGKARIALQLASAQQVIEVGPAFLLDLGPDFDKAKLPHN